MNPGSIYKSFKIPASSAQFYPLYPTVFLCAETGKSQRFILVLVQQMSLVSPVLGKLF